MLHGERIRLRPVREGDLDALWEAHVDIRNRGAFFPLGVQSEPAFRQSYAEHGLWSKEEGFLVIATPEFCQTAICGPVLDLVIEALPDYPTITAIHAEVYADPLSGDDPRAGGLAPITDAFALSFEPTLYLMDATGTVVTRLDSVYDRVELREALDQIA